MNNILEEIKKLDISEEVFKDITKIFKKYETVLNPNSLYYIIIQMFNTEEYFKDKSYDCEFGIMIMNGGGGSATLINNIDNLEIFPNLYSIMFGENTITDWSPLLKLKNLKELWLRNIPNSNIEVLHQLEKLEQITIYVYDNNDLKFIEKFNGKIAMFFIDFKFKNYDKELLKQIYLKRKNIMYIDGIDDEKEYKKLDNFINSIKNEIENN